MIIYYLLTENCNLNCTHCIRGNSTPQTMSYDKALQGLHDLSQVYPQATLVLSGGEPTLHKDFLTILDTALSLFDMVVINSNGTTSFFQTHLKKYNGQKLRIQYSLDGTSEYHDKIRGVGTFQSILSNIEYLNANGFPIWISSVVTKNNLSSIRLLPKILENYNIEKWHLSPIMPFGNATVKDLLPVETWNTFVDELIQITPFRLGIRKLFYFEQLDKLADDELSKIEESDRNKEFRNCGCVRNKIYIYPDMSVCVCTCLKNDKLGYLDKENITSILNCEKSQRYLNIIADNEVCNACRYKKICNGGCMGLYIKYGYDIRCPKINKYYEKDILF